MIKDIHKVEKGTFELTWHDNIDFSKLKPVTQVYGVCFNKKGEILIINTTGNWQLPGGTPEKGEGWEDTLIREVKEEADVEIKNIVPLGYQKVYHKEKNSISYQLRFLATISKINKQTIDPAEGKIPRRKFVNPENFFNYCHWVIQEKL